MILIYIIYPNYGDDLMPLAYLLKTKLMLSPITGKILSDEL